MNELQTLRRLRAQVTPRGDDGLHQQRERLLAEITSTPRRFRWLHGMRPRADRLWVPALAGALTLAVLFSVLGVVFLQSQPANPMNAVEPDQWIYTRTVEVVTDVEGRTTRETWLRGDFGSVVARNDDGTVDRNRGDMLYLGDFDSREDLHDFYQALLDGPESGLAALNARIDQIAQEQDMTPNQPLYTSEREYRIWRLNRAFLLVRDALQNTAPSPEAQEALYQTYRRLPGVESDGVMQDAAGRTSIALGVPHAQYSSREDPNEDARVQLLFDPDTHTYHGYRAVTPEGDSGSEALVATGIVDEPEQVP